MMKRPAAFWIQCRIKIGAGFIQQFFGSEAVKTQQPVGLVQAMLPQEGRLAAFGRQQSMFCYRNISGVKDALEMIIFGTNSG